MNEIQSRGLQTKFNHTSPMPQPSGIQIEGLSPDLIKCLCAEIIMKKNAIEIAQVLLDRGIDMTSSMDIFHALPDYVQSGYKHAIQLITTGFSVMVIGLAIFMLPLHSGTQLTMLIVSYSLMLGGAIRFIHGVLRKNHFGKLRENLPIITDSIPDLSALIEANTVKNEAIDIDYY